MRELIKISLFSAGLALIGYLLLKYAKTSFVHHQVYMIIGFLWMVYSVIHLSYSFFRKNLNVDTPMMLLAGLGLRMILTLFTIMFVVTSGVRDSKLFVINFVAVYFLYLGFEIIALLSNLRRNSSSDQN